MKIDGMRDAVVDLTKLMSVSQIFVIKFGIQWPTQNPIRLPTEYQTISLIVSFNHSLTDGSLWYAISKRPVKTPRIGGGDSSARKEGTTAVIMPTPRPVITRPASMLDLDQYHEIRIATLKDDTTHISWKADEWRQSLQWLRCWI